MKHELLYSIAVIGFLLLTIGCEDFLDQTNSTNLNQETFFDSDEAIQAATAPLYNYVWNEFNDKAYYSMGDGRANNITAQYSDYIYPYTNMNETSLSVGLDNAWGALYSVIAQANNTINNIMQYATDNVSEEARNNGIAEARFMRGTAYWYLASLWGLAIIYENTTDMVEHYVTPAHNRTDVMEFAIRDLEYAAKYLPEMSKQTGRITQYSAYGMLSRIYLSMAGLTTEGAYNQQNIAIDMNRGTRNIYYLNLAKKAALKVVGSSQYGLMDNYGDLFTYENNNCKEALFQLQWLTGSKDVLTYGSMQTITCYFGWSSMVTDATNWGGATYCSWDLWQTYDPADKERRHASVASYGEYYPELNKRGGGYTYGVTENPGSQGANIKKYVIGTNADNGVSYKQSSGLNTHMLRLAEVYLNLAEAILGNDASTNDAIALKYYNLVRSRAKMPIKNVITYEDLKYERRIEFAFEGQYWYDLLRRSYYQQQEVVNYLNNQNRNASYTWDTGTGKYKIDASYVAPGEGVAVATVKSLTLPISDIDQNKNQYLRGNIETVSYTFGEREINTDDLYE